MGFSVVHSETEGENHCMQAIIFLYCFFLLLILGLVHAKPKEIENGGFTLKANQMFSVHITPKEFKNATITGHFGFVFEKRPGWEIT